MLHTKFCENWPARSGKEDFLRVFTIYMGVAATLEMPQTKLCSPYPRRLHIKFGFDRPSGF